jgi:hypothetical protein
MKAIHLGETSEIPLAKKRRIRYPSPVLGAKKKKNSLQKEAALLFRANKSLAQRSLCFLSPQM